MHRDVIVPKLGLTMEEGTVIEWHRADGERVARGQPLFTIETDKVAYEVAAEADGFLERVVGLDATLPVGALVGRLHERADAVPAARTAAAPPPPPRTAAPPRPSPADTAPAPPSPSGAADVRPPPGSAPRTDDTDRAPGAAAQPAIDATGHPASLAGARRVDGTRVLASPVARRIAIERGFELASIVGTGPGGAVLKRDVEAASASPDRSGRRLAEALAPADCAAAATRRRPLAGMRRAIARRMSASLAGAAQLTAFARVDMGEAERLRRLLVADAETLGARITVTDLVLKCVAVALAETPAMREWIDGDEIVSTDAVDVGLAVALDDGLVVPVLRGLDRLSLIELSNARRTLVERARGGRLEPGELQGGCFTLSNFGTYGGDFETPILNPPQSAMLGIGRIADDVVARDGVPTVRPTMWLSMTYDHRLIDGALAGRFRARLKALLEQPQRLLATTR